MAVEDNTYRAVLCWNHWKYVNNCSADCLESPIYVLVDAEGLNDFEAQELHTQSIKIHVQSLPLRKLNKVYLAGVCNNVLHFA